MYYKFCEKCGNVSLGNPYLEERCLVCNNIKKLIPEKYISKNEVLTDKEILTRINEPYGLIEELVKTSPEFDQYLFDHRDEILAKKSAQLDRAMAHGKAILEGKSSTGKNIPKCPTCGSTNIEKISVTKKVAGGFLFGLFSSDVRNTMHCKKCGHKW